MPGPMPSNGWPPFPGSWRSPSEQQALGRHPDTARKALGTTLELLGELVGEPGRPLSGPAEAQPGQPLRRPSLGVARHVRGARRHEGAPDPDEGRRALRRDRRGPERTGPHHVETTPEPGPVPRHLRPFPQDTDPIAEAEA